MLREHGAEFRYRDYRHEPLSGPELRRLLKSLGAKARDLLRKNDGANRDLGLDGSESDAVLIPLMAKHPTLLQRPIGVSGGKAVVGRPPERLLLLIGQ